MTDPSPRPTRATDLLGVRYPILAAPMDWIARARMERQEQVGTDEFGTATDLYFGGDMPPTGRRFVALVATGG